MNGPGNTGALLSTCVSIGYTAAMKDVGLRIRIDHELRQAFIDACREQDRPAAQVIREFMREFVVAHTKDVRVKKSISKER